MLYATQLVARNFFTKRQMFGSLAEMMREAADRYLGQAYELASKEYQILATPRSSQEFLDQHPFLEFRGRFRQFGDLEFGLASPELATIIAGALEQMVPRSPPAALLNLRPGRLAAWRAHATRGTYDARKAG
jgi:hypothetical protein